MSALLLKADITPLIWSLRSLNEGQTVEYEIESNRHKESATLRVK